MNFTDLILGTILSWAELFAEGILYEIDEPHLSPYWFYSKSLKLMANILIVLVRLNTLQMRHQVTDW